IDLPPLRRRLEDLPLLADHFARAIAHCQGKYIALADQDDVWLPEKVETLVNNIGHHSLIYSNAFRIDQKKRVQSNLEWTYFTIPSRKEEQFKQLLYKLTARACAIMFRRELLSKALPFPDAGIDWWLAIVATRMNGIKYLNTSLFYHREHSDNYSFQGYYPYWRAILHFFTIKAQYQRRIYTIYLYDNLKAAYQSPIFNNFEKEYLKEAMEYIEDICNSRLHLKTARREIKYRSALYPYTSVRQFLKKWLYIISKVLY
ncbi:MAG: glycosyltransferase, partial [Candidatus Hodarchaeota archaeon]